MRKTNPFAASFAALAVLLACCGSAWAGELRPAGPEFNPGEGESFQAYGDVARFADGRFMVAWVDEQGGCCGLTPVVARVFEANGQPVGPEVQIGTTGQRVELTILPPGDRFILTTSGAWRLFDQSLTAVGPEVALESPSPSIVLSTYGTVLDSEGRVAILCQYHSVYSQFDATLQIERFLLDGTRVGEPTVVMRSTLLYDWAAGEGHWPLGMVATSDGNLAVAWAHFEIHASTSPPWSGPIYSTGWIRRYDASGASVGPDFSFTGGQLSEEGEVFGKVAADGVGHLVIGAFVNQRYSSGDPPLPILKRVAVDGSSAIDLPLPAGDYPPSVVAVDASANGRVAVLLGPSYPGAPSGSLLRYDPDGQADSQPLSLTDDLLAYGYPSAVSIDTSGSAVASFWLRDFNTPIGVRVRRFCDSDDASCRRCPAYDDAVDSDGDDLPDGCDPCNLLDAGQVPTFSSTAVKYGGSTEPSQNFFPIKSNGVRLVQRFRLPPGTAFADLPVETDGFRLRIEAADGGAMVDITVPGGVYAGRGTAGWLRRRAKFQFLDNSGTPDNGLRRIVISDFSSIEPGLVNVQLIAEAGAYAVAASYPPIRSIVVLGGESSAGTGLCSETDYEEDDCLFEYASSPRIRCTRR